jgi:hypothetical protein
MMIIPSLIMYIYYYWNNENPPIYDVVSPITTLLLIPYVNNNMVLACLLLESMADYYMDKSNLRFPIFLFSLSHIIKQIIHLQINIISSISLGISLICLLLIVLSNDDDKIDLYIIILITTFMIISYVKKSLDISMLMFILSDILIGIDLKYKLYPRQIRVILVPLLYWISQKIYINYFFTT